MLLSLKHSKVYVDNSVVGPSLNYPDIPYYVGVKTFFNARGVSSNVLEDFNNYYLSAQYMFSKGMEIDKDTARLAEFDPMFHEDFMYLMKLSRDDPASLTVHLINSVDGGAIRELVCAFGVDLSGEVGEQLNTIITHNKKNFIPIKKVSFFRVASNCLVPVTSGIIDTPKDDEVISDVPLNIQISASLASLALVGSKIFHTLLLGVIFRLSYYLQSNLVFNLIKGDFFDE